MYIKDSELIINPDGSIYHLNLHPNELATTIIAVGDPDRVDEVTKTFDEVYFTKQKREFRTSMGRVGNKDISVISTGIGTDNIDIVINELDALVNVDLKNRTIKPNHTSLDIIRLGTSGSMRSEIPVDSIVLSAYAIGMDNLLNFYNQKPTIAEEVILENANFFLKYENISASPYAVTGSKKLLDLFTTMGTQGITVTCPGFYGPQGRQIRLAPKGKNYITSLQNIKFNGLVTTNFEMETSGIYGLSGLLGHHAISINAIVANRVTGEFSKQAGKTITHMIEEAVGLLSI